MRKFLLLVWTAALIGCSGRRSATDGQSVNNKTQSSSPNTSAYSNDQKFLHQYHRDLIELQAGEARALICPAYQGRVMTSTADGKASYGWLNYELIRSGKRLPHMNAFGGEDRFWLGPEGGQYALFFKKGEPFDAKHWQTPAVIDTEPFTLATKTNTSATFTRNCTVTNYAGTQFVIGIERTVSLVSEAEISKLLDIKTN